MTKRLIVLLLFFASPLWATTYYVDNCLTVGNDRNNGISTSTPWLTVNKVNTSKFNPGDSILFRSACTWREQLAVPSSGAAGKPITFGAYGKGAQPIISGAGLITSWTLCAGSIYYASYSTAPNQVFEDGARLTQETVSAASLEAGQWYLDTVHKWIWVYLTAGDSPTRHTMEASQRSYAIYLNATPYITVQNLLLNGASWADFYAGGNSDYLSLLNNTVQNSGDAAWKACVYLGGASHGLIQGNTVKNCAGHGIYLSGYGSVTTQNNTVQFNSVSYCALTIDDQTGLYIGPYPGTSANVLRYNQISNCGTAATRGAGIMVDTAGGPATIYGNVVSLNTNGCIDEGSGNPSIVYNNTCYSNNQQVWDVGELNTFGSATGVTFRNNIAVASNGKHVVVSSGGNSFNYNDYYGGSLTPFGWSGTSYDFAIWQTASGQDVNSLNSDPEFSDPSTGQFWLTSGSRAIDAGSNLGSPYNIELVPGSTWPNSIVTGDENAHGSGWEIGAFVYVPPIAAP